MKSLFLFLALAFLVHAKPNPERERVAESDVTTDSVAQMAEGNGPADDDAPRYAYGYCYYNQGYCWPRNQACSSGYVFLEQYNTCLNSIAYKCCVR